jgi:hypothetical protein
MLSVPSVIKWNTIRATCPIILRICRFCFVSKRRRFNTIFQVTCCDVLCLKGEWVSVKQCEIPVPLALSTPELLVTDVWRNVSKRRDILCVTSHSDVSKKRMSFSVSLSNFFYTLWWFLGTFAKLRKAIIGLIMPFCRYQRSFHLLDFREILKL